MEYNQQQIKQRFERRNKLSAEEKLLDEKPTAEDLVRGLLSTRNNGVTYD